MFNSMLILESTWDSDSLDQKSVWPFISEFAKIREIRAFHKSFSDAKSFEHWIERFNNQDTPSPKLLYVAAHGQHGQIGGLNRNIRKTSIKEILKKYDTIKYLHFGTCFFGKNDNFEDFLDEIDHLRWVAGYQNEVDWIDSTLFDILVWGRMTDRNENNKGVQTHTIIGDLVTNEVNGLARNLGFKVASRYGERIRTL
jgi:hypothetical protein